MASRFGVDSSGLSRSINIYGEQARMSAEREAQQKQALLTLVAAGTGGIAMGPAGAQGGAAIANLIGPRPNPNAAINLGLGAFQTVRSDAAAAEKKSALDRFSQAVNPPSIPIAGAFDPTADPMDVGQPTEVPGVPNRRAAAGAAAELGDLGTAAGLAFPKQSSKPPDLFTVTVPDKTAEGGVRVLASGVDQAQALEVRSANPNSVMTKLGTTPIKADTSGGDKTEPLYDVWDSSGKNIIANAVPLEDAKKAASDAKGARIRKFDASTAGQGEGKNLPAHMRVDPVDLYVKAYQQVARKSGRTDMLDALSKGGADIETLSRVGNLPQRDIDDELLKLAKAELTTTKPPEERAVAQKIVNELTAKIESRNTEVENARKALKNAQNQEQRNRIIALFRQRGEDLDVNKTDLKGVLRDNDTY